MYYSTTKESLYSAPVVEPVSVEDVAAHCRITSHDDDEELAGLITVARTHLEDICWSAFITQTWDYYWNAFDAQLWLPRPPFQSIVKFQYMNAAGTLTNVSSNVYETSAENGISYARLKYLQTWPTPRGYCDDVYVQVKCGYGDAETNVPMPIRQAIKLLVGHWYSNREPIGQIGTQIEMTVDSLIAPYRFKEM